MKHLQSRDNPQYKQLLRIAAGKARDQVLLEGVHLCEEWLRHQGGPLRAVFDADRLAQSTSLQRLAQHIEPATGLTLDATLYARLSQVAGQGQGVCFVVNRLSPNLPLSIVDNVLWLDRVQDPGNLGTLLRTAAAVGIRQVFVSEGSVSAWSPKVLRSAQGAHFALQVFEHVDLLALCERLRVPLVATALEHGQMLYGLSLPKACAWLAGNEGQGVDPALLARADLRVFIPQSDAVESLNVGVATAVCLYEQLRQHQAH